MDLRDYLTLLADSGNLRKICGMVDPDLELAGLSRREFARENGAALIFETLVGSQFRAVSNLFGSEARMARVLRCESLNGFSAILQKGLRAQQGSANERLLNLAGATRHGQVVSASLWRRQPLATLNDLPAIRSWPQEGRPYLTLALVISRHPLTGEQNLGLYRVQVQNDRHAAINFPPGSGAGEHLAIAADMGRPLPVALVFGSDPALYWLAAAPLPVGCEEYGLFRHLFGEDLLLSPGLTQELLVPADAEFVVEGAIQPGKTCLEGPFGNHSGSYVTRADCPVLEISSIAWRDQAIMPFTVVGPPPSENVFLGRANEVLLRELLRIDYPEIINLQMPELTLFHGVAILQVAASNTSAVSELIARLWHESPLRNSKLLVVVDADLDLTRFDQVYWRLVNQLEDRRIYRQGQKIALDATGVDPQRLVVEDKATAELIRRRSADYDG